MSGFEPTEAADGIRRRRLVFRAWHRGMREMDLVMGQFADRHAGTLSPDLLDQFEALMDAPDPDIFRWITGSLPTPANYDTPLLRLIRTFHGTAGAPTNG